jgi:hypothetical protein
MAYIPHGIRVPIYEVDLCWRWALWGRRKWSQRREREQGKKKEQMRKNEEEMGRRPTYNTRASASMAPLVHYRVPGRMAPLRVGPRARYKGGRPNGAL